MTRLFRFALFLSAAVVFSPFRSSAQLLNIFEPVLKNEQSSPARGYLQSGTYDISGFDDISINSGVVTISIPITSLARGRGGNGFDLSLTYNSRSFDSKVVYQTDVTAPDGPVGESTPQGIVQFTNVGAWKYSFEYGLEAEKLGEGPEFAYVGCTTSVNFGHGWRLWLNTPDGGRRALHLRGQDELEGYYRYGFDGKLFLNGCGFTPTELSPPRLTFFTSDGSFIKVEIDRDGTDWTQKQWTVYFPDGRRIVGRNDQADEIIDANGNRIIIEPIGASSFRLTEELGNQSPQNDAESKRYIEIVRSGFTDTITQRGFNDQLATWTVDWSSTDGFNYWCTDETNSSDPPDPYTCQYSGHQVVTGIVLPDLPGHPYTFTYNGPGDEMSHAVLPSGATVDYAFEPNQDPVTYWFWFLKRSMTSETLSHDGPTSPDTWTYSGLCPDTGSGNITVTNPDGGTTVHLCQGDRITKITEPNGDTLDRFWAENIPEGVFNHGSPLNSYVEKEIRTITGTSSRASVRTFKYNKNGQITQQDECDWVASGATNCTSPVRRKVWEYYVNAPDAGTAPSSSDITSYWREQIAPLTSVDGRRLNAVKRREIRQGASAVAAAAEFDYDDPLTTGNLTEERSWDSTKDVISNPLTASNSISRGSTFTNSGNVQTTEIRPGLTATYSYDILDLYPTAVTIGGLTMGLNYDVYSGRLASRTDPNSLTTSFDYDNINRVKSVTEAGLRTTTTDYDDNNRIVIVKRDLNNRNDGSIQTATHYDQLGRVSLVRQSDGAALTPTSTTDGIKTKTIYRTESGRSCQIISNPHRTGGEPSMGWTRTRTDQNGRPVETAFFSTQPSDCTTVSGRTGWTATSYDSTVDGRKVAVSEKADDGDKNRDSYLDALDRLTRVVEYPGTGSYTTNYSYDAFDNLATVTQGSQFRQFVYDSLGRLKTAMNPESGTIGYTYFDSGLLKTKTDARTGTASNSYDNLDRLVATTYSGGGAGFDNTPDVLRCYDGKLYNPVTRACDATAVSLPGALQSLTVVGPKTGQLTAVGNAVSATYFTQFDSFYQTKASAQYTNSNRYDFAYGYNLAGGLTSETYPSGRSISYTYDPAGRIDTASGTKGSDTTLYASQISYAPHGAVTSLKLGNDIIETTIFNSRLQPQSISAGALMTLTFNYGANNNNGNVLQQIISRMGPFSAAQYYRYDGVNRLAIAAEGAQPAGNDGCPGGAVWCRDYTYDAFGNRAIIDAPGAPASQFAPTGLSQFSALTNRIATVPGAANPVYDDAGNLVSHDGVGVNLVYDANNKMASYTGTSQTLQQLGAYAYDADGHRVQRQSTIAGASVTTTYIYDAFGKLAAEYATQATETPGTRYRTTDHLGSTRLVTNADGTPRQCLDFLPFGEPLDDAIANRSLLCYSNPSDSPFPQKFTGKERDIESGLDYILARYYGSHLGLFSSPDPGGAGVSILNPQTWNGYAYVNNNPMEFVDPDGESATFGGAIVGAVGGGLIAAYRGQDISTGILKGTIVGAAAGTVIDTAGTSYPVAAAVIAGAISGGSGVALDQTFAGESIDPADVALGVGFGAAVGYGGAKLLPAIQTAIRSLSFRGGLPETAVLAQKSFGENFSAKGQEILKEATGLTIKTIDDLAGGLRSGAVSADKISVNVIVRNGKTIILNTRTAIALERAGIPRSGINVVDQTGNEFFESLLDAQLMRNGLSEAGAFLTGPK